MNVPRDFKKVTYHWCSVLRLNTNVIDHCVTIKIRFISQLSSHYTLLNKVGIHIQRFQN